MRNRVDGSLQVVSNLGTSRKLRVDNHRAGAKPTVAEVGHLSWIVVMSTIMS